jgi:hypothetical protein
VHREIGSFALGDLVGSSEVEVRARFGEPDDVARPGGETSDAAGQVVFLADADLSYYGLLPHTCLTISIVRGHVAQLSWWPKWKRCPPGSVATASDVYAPE